MAFFFSFYSSTSLFPFFFSVLLSREGFFFLFESRAEREEQDPRVGCKVYCLVFFLWLVFLLSSYPGLLAVCLYDTYFLTGWSLAWEGERVFGLLLV